MKNFFVVDVDRCWGCKSCITACKREHGYSADAPDAIQVMRIEGYDGTGHVQCDFLPVLCLHCDDADCKQACPVGAIKRIEDGTVLLERNLCVGCGRCEKVCQYGAITIERATSTKPKALKCDWCIDRRKRGLAPACVQHCMGRALSIVNEQQLKSIIANRYSFVSGHAVYVSSKLSELGKAMSKQ